jgi:hypothetical protein
MHVAAPFNFVIPDTFTLVLLVKKNDCPDKLFKLLNIVVEVEVEFKFDNCVVCPLIDNDEFDDNHYLMSDY